MGFFERGNEPSGVKRVLNCWVTTRRRCIVLINWLVAA